MSITISASLVKELRERTGAPMMECQKLLKETNGNVDAAIEAFRKSGKLKAEKRSSRVAAEGLIGAQVDAKNQTVGFMVEINSETDFVSRDASFKQFVSDVVATGLTLLPQDVDSLLSATIVGSKNKIEETREELVARIGENIAIRRLITVRGKGTRLGVYVHGGRIGVLVDVQGGDEQLAKDLAVHIAACQPIAINKQDVSAEVLEKERKIFADSDDVKTKPPQVAEKMVAGRLQKFLEEITLLEQPFVKQDKLTVGQILSEHKAQVLSFVRFVVGEGIEKKQSNFADEVKAQVEKS